MIPTLAPCRAFAGSRSKAMTGALGYTATGVAAKSLAHYRRKVRANRRRLIKG